ncbi:MAG: formylmethanofuran dehydrogenase subunit E family protein [Armatimonadia bacterium]
MEDQLKLLKGFHGHLGPYVTAGLRMGRFALKRLQAKPHQGVEADVWCPASPPASCIMDGIQVATGCTLGKHNLRHHVDDEMRVLFRNRHTNEVVMLGLRAEAMQRAMAILEEESDTAASEFVANMPEGELLEELRGD